MNRYHYVPYYPNSPYYYYYAGTAYPMNLYYNNRTNYPINSYYNTYSSYYNYHASPYPYLENTESHEDTRIVAAIVAIAGGGSYSQ